MEQIDDVALAHIRENERKSHLDVYSTMRLYESGSWLSKLVRSICDVFPYFSSRNTMEILDLGSGVGRNSIAVAQHFRDIPCRIDCVDILEFAIEMLQKNAEAFHVSESIRGIAQAIDEFPILPASYDWIIAVSALEHVISKEVFLQKLSEIKEGLRNGGIVSIIMNSSVREFRKRDGMEVAPQFEVNFTAEEAQEILSDTFSDWELLKFSIHDQHYDIPRDGEIYELYSKVITYFARKN